jgi:hypothetical protein
MVGGDAVDGNRECGDGGDGVDVEIFSYLGTWVYRSQGECKRELREGISYYGWLSLVFWWIYFGENFQIDEIFWRKRNEISVEFVGGSFSTNINFYFVFCMI